MQAKKTRVPLVGQVREVIHHPNADHLYIAFIDTGQPEVIKVIFGGNRVLKPGDLVPIALKGTRLPSGEKIRPRNWRGIKSYAELLSSDELGWTVGGPDEVVVFSPETYNIGDELPVNLLEK